MMEAQLTEMQQTILSLVAMTMFLYVAFIHPKVLDYLDKKKEERAKKDKNER